MSGADRIMRYPPEPRWPGRPDHDPDLVGQVNPPDWRLRGQKNLASARI